VELALACVVVVEATRFAVVHSKLLGTLHTFKFKSLLHKPANQVVPPATDVGRRGRGGHLDAILYDWLAQVTYCTDNLLHLERQW
jgi:hypothetical protein